MPYERLPTTAIAITDTNASDPTATSKLLLIGIKRSGGLATVDVPVRLTSEAQVQELFGDGSQLHGMYMAARRVSSTLEIWGLPVAEPGGGVVATGKFAVTGTTTTARPLVLRIEDVRVEVTLGIGDDDEAVVDAVVAELAKAKYSGLHCTASDATTEVTITARSKGLHGNDIALKVLEQPPGITVTVTAMASGSGASSLTAGLTALGSERFHYIVLPQRDTVTLGSVKDLLDARWAADAAIDGHAFASGGRATVGTMLTLGNSLDDKHLTIVSEPGCPTPAWKQAAVVAATRALQTNPNITLRNVDLAGLMPADLADRTSRDDRESLLLEGITPLRVVTGKCRVERTVTLAKTNDIGQPSETFLDLETRLTISAVRQLMLLLLDPLIGRILVDDAGAVTFGPLVPIIDAEGVRQLLLAQYQTDLLERGWVNDYETFAAELVVAKTGPNEITYTWPGTVAGHLYTITGSLNFKVG